MEVLNPRVRVSTGTGIPKDPCYVHRRVSQSQTTDFERVCPLRTTVTEKSKLQDHHQDEGIKVIRTWITLNRHCKGWSVKKNHNEITPERRDRGGCFL